MQSPQINPIDLVTTRSQELEIVAEVSAIITRITNLDELLQTVSDLTKERFSLYHAHIYLLSEDGKMLQLAGGAGEAGRMMKTYDHAIAMDRHQSVVAQSARTRQGVIVDDVRKEPNFLPNPLLLETSSEMAVPIIANEALIGVLDMQSKAIGHFTTDDVRTKTILANQIAVAVQNARSFATTQQLLTENEILRVASEAINAANTFAELVEAVAPVIPSESTALVVFENYDRSTATYFEIVASTLDSNTIQSGTRYPIAYFPVASADAQFGAVEDIDDPDQVDAVTAASIKQFGWRAYISINLLQGTRAMGNLTCSSAQPRRYTESERRLIQNIGGLVSAALERARLRAETDAARDEAELLYRLGSAINAAENEQQLVDAFVTNALPTGSHAVSLTRWENDNFDHASYIEVAADWYSDKRPTLAGVQIPISRFPLSSLMDSDRIQVVDDVHNNPKIDSATAATLSSIGDNAFISAPLARGTTWMGSLSVISAQPRIHSDRELRIMRSLMQQMSTALERMQLLRQTQERAGQLAIVAQVSAATASILDLDQLLNTVAELTKSSFRLYHAHIYLLDDDQALLQLAAGAGEPGRLMRERGHHIALDSARSLVARAARTRDGVIIADVTQAPDFLPNDLLPNTRSEMAVPIVTNDKLMGVLDMQSDIVGHFTGEDIRIMTTLADQVAVAVQNARSFATTQQLLTDNEVLRNASAAINAANTFAELVEAVAPVIPSESTALVVFENYDLGAASYFETVAVRGLEVSPLGTRFPIAYFPAANTTRFFHTVENVDDPAQLDAVTAANVKQLGYRAYVSTNLARGAHVMGSLTYFSTQPRRYTESERRLVQNLGGLVSSALERARLRAETEAAREEAELLFRLGAGISSAQNEQQLVDAFVNDALPVGSDAVSLTRWENNNFKDTSYMQVLGDWHRDERPTLRGARVPISSLPIVPFMSPTVILTIDDVHNDPTVDPISAASFSNVGDNALISAPLISGTTWIGNLTIFSTHPRIHGEREIRILRSVTQQLSTALERIQLLRQTQERAQRLETVAQVSAATATILNVDHLLQTVTDLTKARFGLYHAHVYLVDADSKWLILAAGAGEAGNSMKEHGHKISLANPHSLVARAARTREGVLVNDVTQTPDFLPNPLLPNTRSEIAVPMTVGDTLIGILDVQADTANHFTAEDMQINSALADQISVAVQNAQLYQGQVKIAEQLREIDRLKSEFLASMSHELRTPLNSIIGYAEVMIDGIDGELPTEAIEDVTAIHDSGHHLLTLINDILDLAKIEAGHMELDLDMIGLHDTLSEVKRITSVLLKDKPVELVLILPDHLPLLNADEDRLRQILNNLISNAIKFTENGQIIVRASSTPDNKFVQVDVQDSGIGIAPEHQNLVFEQFRQVDGGSTRKVGGTGLGLPITQKLVQMHGGTIWLNSAIGSGSTFSFTIPIADAQVTQAVRKG